MGIGAAAVLAAGVLAAGCSEEGDTFVTGGGGGGGDLNANNNFPGNSVASSNLAADGGGLSPNGQDIQSHILVFNDDNPASDGTYDGDNSGVLMFTTQDPNGRFRVFASYYENGQFTPPAELSGDDRDERVNTNLSAAVLLPLNTQSYASGAQGTDAINAVRNTAGDWVLLWDGQTFFQHPTLSISQQSDVPGARRVLYMTWFHKAQRQSAVGSVTRGGTARATAYGFESVADQVSTITSGGSPAGFQTPQGTAGPGSNGGPTVLMPAASLTSFGVVTDGLSRQATFGGDALPFTGTRAVPDLSDLDLRNAVYDPGEATTFVSIVWTQVVTSVNGGGSFVNLANNAVGGQELALFARTIDLQNKTLGTQTRLDTAVPAARNTTATTQAGTQPFPTLVVYNGHLFFKYADASLNVNTAPFSDVDVLGMQAATAGNTVGGGDAAGQAFRYDNTGGHEGAALTANVFHEEIIAHVFFSASTNNDGTTTIATTQQDLSLVNSAAGVHDVVNPTSSGLGFANPFVAADIAPNREIQNFDAYGDRFVFGADEGLGDTTIFYVSADNTNTTGSANIDRGLVAACFKDTDGTFQTGTNPLAITDPIQAEDFHRQQAGIGGTNQGSFRFAGTVDATNTRGVTGRTSLQDPLVRIGSANGTGGASYATGGSDLFAAQMNRTGEWVGVAWIMDVGVSTDFRQAAHVLAYQTFRPVSVNTGGGSVAPTAPNFEVRFSSLTATGAGATRALNTTVSLGDTSVEISPPAPGFDGFARLNNAETSATSTHLPVNMLMWQENLDYRCGFQADKDKMFILWEQSDATEDRLFARRVDVTLGATGTPTVALQGAVELESTASVPGQANFNRLPGGTTVASRSTFRFIEGNLANLTAVESSDNGLDATGAGGSIVVLFHKVTDNTGSVIAGQPNLTGLGGDADEADSDIILVEVNGATISARVENMVANVNENAPVGNNIGGASSGGQLVEEGGTLSSSVSANAVPAGFQTAAGSGLVLVPVPANSDIAQAPSHGPEAIYIYMTGPTSTGNFTGGRGLFTRRLDVKARNPGTTGGTTTATGLAERLNPVATPGADYKAPTRLDGGDSGRVTIRDGLVAASRVLLFFTDDGHFWAQETSDGITYQTENGAADPYLLDNDTSSNVINTNVWHRTKADCSDIDGSVATFTKEDLGSGGVGASDDRLKARNGIR